MWPPAPPPHGRGFPPSAIRPEAASPWEPVWSGARRARGLGPPLPAAASAQDQSAEREPAAVGRSFRSSEPASSAEGETGRPDPGLPKVGWDPPVGGNLIFDGLRSGAGGDIYVLERSFLLERRPWSVSVNSTTTLESRRSRGQAPGLPDPATAALPKYWQPLSLATALNSNCRDPPPPSPGPGGTFRSAFTSHL